MNASELFLYTASAGIIILLVMVVGAFFLLYRTLITAQLFLSRANSMVAGIQLMKTGTAITAFSFLRNLIKRFK
jgi:hypothetical protein